eukprot:SAG11_NODE_7097_length_1194_cov_1.200913_1_plen_135_part_00
MEERFDNLFSVSVDWRALREILASIDKELQSKASKESIASMVQQMMGKGDELGRLRREVVGRIDSVDVRVEECAVESAAALAKIESLENSLQQFTVFDQRLQQLEFALAGYPSGAFPSVLAEICERWGGNSDHA